MHPETFAYVTIRRMDVRQRACNVHPTLLLYCRFRHVDVTAG